MRRLVLVPDGWPCTLAECPPGAFVFDYGKTRHLGFRSEYYLSDHRVQAYNEGGESFCPPDGEETVVQPVLPKWEEVDE